MKILVFGSGVIGSIYAARLHELRVDVTLLARGNRFEEISRDGVTISNTLTGERITRHVPVIRELSPTDYYDLIIVTVRLDQLNAVIPVLKQNKACPLILFMLNNPDDSIHLRTELQPKHILLGLPGAGGINLGGQIEYIQIAEQPTTIGEIDGKPTDQIKEIKRIFETAGFDVNMAHNMPAWLKTHAVFVSCMSAAIIHAGGDSVRLSRDKAAMRSLVRSVREGFTACKALGLPIQPANLQVIFMMMPIWFCVLYWRNALKGKIGTLAMAPHANAAKDEMRLLAEKVIAMMRDSSIPTPNLDNLLLSFIQK
jgi:2-dehydropantoate 2-reductase